MNDGFAGRLTPLAAWARRCEIQTAYTCRIFNMFHGVEE